MIVFCFWSRICFLYLPWYVMFFILCAYNVMHRKISVFLHTSTGSLKSYSICEWNLNFIVYLSNSLNLYPQYISCHCKLSEVKSPSLQPYFKYGIDCSIWNALHTIARCLNLLRSCPMLKECQLLSFTCCQMLKSFPISKKPFPHVTIDLIGCSELHECNNSFDRFFIDFMEASVVWVGVVHIM